MRMPLQTLPLVALLIVAACSSPPAGAVDKEQLAAIRGTAAKVAVGAPRDQVLAQYKGANQVRLGSAEIEGATIEEWKVEAFNDQGTGRDLFVQFMYFANGRLVDASDARIAFRENPTIVKAWTQKPATK